MQNNSAPFLHFVYFVSLYFILYHKTPELCYAFFLAFPLLCPKNKTLLFIKRNVELFLKMFYNNYKESANINRNANLKFNLIFFKIFYLLFKFYVTCIQRKRLWKIKPFLSACAHITLNKHLINHSSRFLIKHIRMSKSLYMMISQAITRSKF